MNRVGPRIRGADASASRRSGFAASAVVVEEGEERERQPRPGFRGSRVWPSGRWVLSPGVFMAERLCSASASRVPAASPALPRGLHPGGRA
jgi:hypothetical protein